MTEFTIDITEKRKIDGITKAREAFNAAEHKDEEGEDIIFSTDSEYVQYVMEKAAESYANQYEV